jgi:hypothetical protein
MRERSAVQTVAMLVGAVFLLAGILGFIPGITSDAPGDFAGNDSEAELLGIFHVSILHSLVHVVFGIAGLAMARTWNGARTYLIGGGVIYLALWIYGLLIDQESDANFIPLDTADNWLHFGLGVGMIALGFVTTRERPATTAV